MLLTILVLSSIVPPCHLPYTVTADESIDVHFRAATIYAIATWNRELGRRVFQWVTRGPADITIKAVPELKTARYLARWYGNNDKCSDGGVIIVSTEKKWCTERRRRVMIHELGHALGLKHADADGPKSVMHHETPACGDPDMHDEISDDLATRALVIIGGAW